MTDEGIIVRYDNVTKLTGIHTNLSYVRHLHLRSYSSSTTQRIKEHFSADSALEYFFPIGIVLKYFFLLL